MSDTGITSTDFTAAVEEYRMKQKETMKTFLTNICELGEILSRHRAALKPNSEWTHYLKEIGLGLAPANQQIRMYEYSQKTDKKKLMEGVITNWAKVNLFLALEEDQKEELLGMADGSESTAEFRDKISGIKGDEVEVSDDDEDLMLKTMETMGVTTLKIEDTTAMLATARSLAKTLGLTKDSVPVVLRLLYIVKATEDIATLKPSIPDADKAILNSLVKEQQQAVTDIQLLS